MSKRILLVTDTYLPTISGVTTVVSEYKKELELLGHSVAVAVPETEETTKMENVLTVPGLPSILRSDTVLPLYFVGLENKIDAFNPDVIHIHSPGPLGLWARKWAKKNNVRVVTTVHATPTFSASYLPFSFLYEDFIKESGWKFWEWFLETSDVVIAPSYFIVEKLKKIGIKNTIFRAPFWIEPYQLTKKTQKKKTTDFLFFGRLDPDKNLPFLLESWSKVSVPNAHLTIAGRDLKDQRKDLQTLAKTLGCESTVTVFGKVSEKKKLELFSKTDFFVMPSKVEVQSIVTYQAALSGIPVVVARASALPEIVAHSTAPDLIFDPDDPTSLTRVLEKCCTKKASYTKNYTLSKDFRKSFTKETILNNLVKKIYSI
ncbi:MAG: glycosyltransferase family 4 protein [Candidatus Pacebacteria bacterium]|nr:glycosyltransferase family 4 protein [Candidatus Paceibacterota bacterium]